jgi:hypothetical protein
MSGYKPKRRAVTVTFDDVSQATASEIADFIRDALSWAGGCRHPDDPMFSSLSNVAVRIIKTPTTNS